MDETTDSYPLGYSEDEARRLRLQADLYRSTSLHSRDHAPASLNSRMEEAVSAPDGKFRFIERDRATRLLGL